MKIQIVDSEDNLIGVKERSELNYEKDIYRVSALWLTNSKGQSLLARRAISKDKDPGRWGPAVAGTIDEGETYDENIYKEALEEIGLEGVEFSIGPKTHITYPRNYFCQWYFVKVDKDIDEFVMQEDEVEALAWVDIDIIKKELIEAPEKYVPAMPQVLAELGI